MEGGGGVSLIHIKTLKNVNVYSYYINLYPVLLTIRYVLN